MRKIIVYTLAAALAGMFLASCDDKPGSGGDINSAGGIKSARDLVDFAEQWNATGSIVSSYEREAAQGEVIAAWSDDGTPFGVISLKKNIDMSSVKNFVPIGYDGYESYSFTGVFDGRGHTIRNLRIDSGRNWAGLFATVKGEVHNLTLVDARVLSSGADVGCIAGGLRSDGAIVNCHVDGCDVKARAYAGGITGENNGTIYGCTVSNSNIESTGSAGGFSGGIAGSNMTEISNCHVKSCDISSASYRAGGIAGYNVKVILGSSSFGNNVSANIQAGGIAGFSDHYGNAYNTYGIVACIVVDGDIAASGGKAGGIAGRMSSLMAPVDAVACISAPAKVSTGSEYSGYAGAAFGETVLLDANTIYWSAMNGLAVVGDNKATTISGSEFQKSDVKSTNNFFTTADKEGKTPIERMNATLDEHGAAWRWKAGTAESKWYPVAYEM